MSLCIRRRENVRRAENRRLDHGEPRLQLWGERLEKDALLSCLAAAGCTAAVVAGCAGGSNSLDSSQLGGASSAISMAGTLGYAIGAGLSCNNDLVLAGAVAAAESSLNPLNASKNGPTKGCPSGSIDRRVRFRAVTGARRTAAIPLQARPGAATAVQARVGRATTAQAGMTAVSETMAEVGETTADLEPRTPVPKTPVPRTLARKTPAPKTRPPKTLGPKTRRPTRIAAM
jgi:hypothetical protein